MRGHASPHIESYTLKRSTKLFRSTAKRDNSWLEALVCSAPEAVELDRSRILTRFLSTSRATLACSSAALAIDVLCVLISLTAVAICFNVPPEGAFTPLGRSPHLGVSPESCCSQ